MFSKIFNLILVYILITINFSILLLPIALVAFPIIHFYDNQLLVNVDFLIKIKFALSFLIFLVSALMLFYLFLDFLFGISQFFMLKDCKRYDKIKDYEFLRDIFSDVKKKFGCRSVKLYIKNSGEINAFALGSLGRKSIILTNGLVNHYLQNTDNSEEFIAAIRGVMSHEMSHLINKDFLPGLLMTINSKVTNFVSKILNSFLMIFVNIFSIFGIRNRLISELFLMIYRLINWVLTAFNNYVIYNLYEFLRKGISRATEYRCDRQAAQAFGGTEMALSLALLGKSGYFTLFSTHPATSKRVKKVSNIKVKNGIIRASFIGSLANYLALMILVVICLSSTKASGIDLMIRNYLSTDHSALYQNINYFWNLSKNLYNFLILNH